MSWRSSPTGFSVLGLLHDASRDKAANRGDSAQAPDGQATRQFWWHGAIDRTKKS
jgi:hypothetical protein